MLDNENLGHDAADAAWRRFEALLAEDRASRALGKQVFGAGVPPQQLATRRTVDRTTRSGFARAAAGAAVAITLAVAALTLGPEPSRGPGAPLAEAPAVQTAPVAPPEAQRADPPRPPRKPWPAPFLAAAPGAPEAAGHAAARLAPAASPMATEEPPAPPPRPAEARPWVVVHAVSLPGPAQAIARALRAAGFADVKLRRVETAPAVAELRHFRAADRAHAERAATAAGFGAGTPIRDFSHYSPSPEAGLVEIWTP
jgi:hypothetical protein